MQEIVCIDVGTMGTTQYVELETVEPSHAIIERIAGLEEVEQTKLDPLYEAVDSDALDTLVGPTGRSDPSLQIEFTYHGYEVTVTGDGTVHIDENVSSER